MRHYEFNAKQIATYIDDCNMDGIEVMHRVFSDEAADASAADIHIIVGDKEIVVPGTADTYVELQMFLIECENLFASGGEVR